MDMDEMQMLELAADTADGGELMELSESDLDLAAGGAMIDMGSFSSFKKKDVMMGQSTFAGPNGAGTTSFFASSEIESVAAQFFRAEQ
jgi:hypothetical protein